MTTYDRILSLASERGLGLKELAQAARYVDARAIYHIRHHEPRPATLRRIAAVLQVDWRSLLGD